MYSIFIQRIHMKGIKLDVTYLESIELHWIVMLGNLEDVEEWGMM